MVVLQRRHVLGALAGQGAVVLPGGFLKSVGQAVVELPDGVCLLERPAPGQGSVLVLEVLQA